MKSLDQIGIENQTDKASQFTRTYAKPHDYLRHMEFFFAPLRDKPIKLVEIGVGGGESICTWLEYFRNGLVMGIDIVHDTNIFNTPKRWNSEEVMGRYAFMQADQNSEVFWKCFAADIGQTVDIAIDDGSHEPRGRDMAFAGLWPCLKPGGLYCIEDLACGFTDAHPSHPEFSQILARDLILAQTINIDAAYFSRELIIMRKKA